MYMSNGMLRGFVKLELELQSDAGRYSDISHLGRIRVRHSGVPASPLRDVKSFCREIYLLDSLRQLPELAIWCDTRSARCFTI